MEVRKYNCKGCSKNCWISIQMEQGRVRQVTGNGCQKGKDMVLNFILMD